MYNVKFIIQGNTMGSDLVLDLTNFTEYSYITPYIRYCAEDKYQSNWELSNRKIGDYEFVFITKGMGKFNIRDRIYNVRANDLILLKPNVRHQASSVNLPFEFLCIHFDLYVARGKNSVVSEKGYEYDYNSIPIKPIKYNKIKLDMPEYVQLSDSSSALALIRKIIFENSERHIGSNTIIKALFMELIVLLARQAGKEQIKEHPAAVKAIINHIKANYMNRIQLSELSSLVHLESAYVSSLFKKHTGYTISDFLKIHRLMIAKGFLLETDKKIADIANIVGFYDIQHFSRIFKLEEGLTPSQYRRIKRK